MLRSTVSHEFTQDPAEGDRSNLLPSWKTIYHPAAQSQYVLISPQPMEQSRPSGATVLGHLASELNEEDSYEMSIFVVAQCQHQYHSVPVLCSGP